MQCLETERREKRLWRHKCETGDTTASSKHRIGKILDLKRHPALAGSAVSVAEMDHVLDFGHILVSGVHLFPISFVMSGNWCQMFCRPDVCT